MNDFVTVFQAELVRRIRSRAFLVGLVIGVFAIALMFQLPQFLIRATSQTRALVVIGAPAVAQPAAALLRNEYSVRAVLPPQTPDAALLAAHKAGEAVVVTAQPAHLAVTLYAKDPADAHVTAMRRALAPLQLQLATHLSNARAQAVLNIPIAVRSVSTKFSTTADAQAAHGIAYTLLFFLYILILVNSQIVMSSVAEEKTSRIAELLVAAVDPIALLVGKICAAATLALLQLAVWIVTAAFIGNAAFGAPGGSTGAAAGAAQPFALNALLSGAVISPWVIVAFVLFLILGFFQLSTLFAALTSLINRTEDLGSVTVPLVLPVVFAFIAAITALETPDAGWVIGLSFVPVLSPFIMFARIAVSAVPIWQIALSLAIDVVALALIAVVAGKLYRVGMLLYGRTPNLRQVWSIVRS